MKNFRISRRLDRAGTMTALVIVVLALFYLFNSVLLALADQYKWYFYTAEQYDLTPSGEGDALLSQIDTSNGGVKILFCDTQSKIKENSQLEFVHRTAVSLAERHPDLITVEYVNIWLEPAKLEPYRTSKEGDEITIKSDSVIIDYRGEFLINSPKTFYILDEKNYVVSYNGEETFVASILRVSAPDHPVAYFTANHGEEVPEGLYRLLSYAGYDIERLDLSTVSAVPEDAGLVIISSPIYDFQKAAAGSSYASELKKLENYLNAGGTLWTSLNPAHVGRLTRLCEFLTGYGLVPQEGTVVDATNSLPGSGGYSLLLDYTESELASRLSSFASKNGRRTVLSLVMPISFVESGVAAPEALLTTRSSSVLLSDDGQEVAAGPQTAVAISRLKEGNGKILLIGSAHLTATNAVDSASYGNRDLVYALFTEFGQTRVPIGIPSVAVDRTAVENLTTGEANTFALLAALVFPGAILLGGLIYCRRRKNH